MMILDASREIPQAVLSPRSLIAMAMILLIIVAVLMWVARRRRRAFFAWLRENGMEGLPLWLERIRFKRRDRPWETPGVLKVDEPTGRRFEVALELLGEGQPVVYRGLRLSRTWPRRLLVTIAAGRDADRVTEKMARRLIDEAVEEMNELKRLSPAFVARMGSRRLEFLVIDCPDWERWTLGFPICRLRRGKLRWEPGLPKEA